MRNDLPAYPEIRLAILELIAKEGRLSRKEIAPKICKIFDLSEEALNLKYENLNYIQIDYRISWSEVYLVKAGLLFRPRSAVFDITEEGRRILEMRPDSLSNKFLMDHCPLFKDWRMKKSKKSKPKKEPDQEELSASPRKISQFRGCLLAGAIGDALGAPVEFISRMEILNRFGPDGITDFVPCYGKLGAITDDTQMTLFTAEGILRYYIREKIHGNANSAMIMGQSYLRWLKTQEAAFKNANQNTDGWLITNRDFFSLRAPGTTCLSALRRMSPAGEPVLAANDSKGCGGVMRAAPIALFFARNEEIPAELRMERAYLAACEAAGLTHGHPTGYISAGALVLILLQVLEGSDLRSAVQKTLDFLSSEKNSEETVYLLEKAADLSRNAPPSADILRLLGRGWIGEEALGIAVYAALTAAEGSGSNRDKFEQGMILSVNHDGDSDSTGAICGNLLGAIFGDSVFPDRWIRQLELRGVITEIADDLAGCTGWDLSENSPELQKLLARYPI